MVHALVEEIKFQCLISPLLYAGVGGDDLIPALTRFPEVLALSVESQLQENVATLQSEWFVRGLALKKLLRTQPQVWHTFHFVW